METETASVQGAQAPSAVLCSLRPGGGVDPETVTVHC